MDRTLSAATNPAQETLSKKATYRPYALNASKLLPSSYFGTNEAGGYLLELSSIMYRACSWLINFIDKRVNLALETISGYQLTNL